MAKVIKDSTTGKFVTKVEEKANPSGTYKQTVIKKDVPFHHVYISTVTGRIVSKEFAKANPKLCVKKKVKTVTKKKK